MCKKSVFKTVPALNSVIPQGGENSFNDYLRKIANFKSLSPAEEKALAIRIKKGDNEAKKELIKANLKLVVNIARKCIHKSNVPMIDLIQEGNLGLMTAVDKFNFEYGYKFSTYAAWWIRQAMFKAISEQSFCVKIPVYIQETLSRFSKLRREMEQKFNKSVKVDEVAQKMNLSVEKIDNYLNAYTQSISIDAKREMHNGSDIQLSDILEDENYNIYSKLEDEALKNDLAAVLSKLKEREQQVIQWRFGINNLEKRTLEEIGKLYGVTKECIRQTELRALKRMKRVISNECLLVGFVN